MKPKLLGFCLAALPVCFPVVARSEDKKADPAPPARPADAGEEQVFSGYVQAEATAALSSRIAGTVDRVNVDEGDRVKKGQVLIELSAPELKDDVEATEARLDQAKAEVELAEAVVQEAEARAKAPGGRDVTAAEIARAQAGTKVARAGVEVAQVAVKRAQTQLGFTRIVAPFDGVVARRTIDVGTTVGPQRQGESAPLVTVMRDDVVRVVFAVDERNYFRVIVGTPVHGQTSSIGGRGFKGTVTRIAGMIGEPSNGISPAGTLGVEVDLPNAAGKLRPGMYVTVVVKLEEAKR